MTGADPHGVRPAQDIPDLTLAAFLLARLDEDERIARAVTSTPWRRGTGTAAAEGGEGWDQDVVWRTFEVEGDAGLYTDDEDDAAHIARHNPARVLREVEAKRRLVELHEQVPGTPGAYQKDAPATGCKVCHEWDGVTYAGGDCETLRLLALPFADHPDYCQEWRP